MAVYGQQLRMSYILYTVFGTVAYQTTAHSLDCSGVRCLSHMSSLATVIHQCPLSGVSLTRYCVDSSIGRHVEVCESCFMERILVLLYKSERVGISARMDDVTNASHFKIHSVAAFLQHSFTIGILSCQDLHDATLIVEDCFAGGICNTDSSRAREIMDRISPQLSLTVLLTRTGACTYRFSFESGFACGGQNTYSLDHTEHAFRALVVVMNKALRQLC